MLYNKQVAENWKKEKPLNQKAFKYWANSSEGHTLYMTKQIKGEYDSPDMIKEDKSWLHR